MTLLKKSRLFFKSPCLNQGFSNMNLQMINERFQQLKPTLNKWRVTAFNYFYKALFLIKFAVFLFIMLFAALYIYNKFIADGSLNKQIAQLATGIALIIWTLIGFFYFKYTTKKIADHTSASFFRFLLIRNEDGVN